MKNPEDFEPISVSAVEAISAGVKAAPFAVLLGLYFEEIRNEYARMRLPYKPNLNQPAGIVHGGAIASLIDTVVVGAVLSNVPKPPKRILTINMHIHYMDSVFEQDLLACGFTRRRGYKTIFLGVEVVTADSGKPVAHGELAYSLKY